MKRILSFALAACVVLSLAGCAAPSAAPSSAAAAAQAQSAPQGELPPLTGLQLRDMLMTIPPFAEDI